MKAAAGWRAWMARVLSVVVLLAALLVPPFTGAGSVVAAPAVSIVASQLDGSGDAPNHPDRMIHAGAHCACQLADRLEPPGQLVPSAAGTVLRPVHVSRPLASHAVDPPARPPQA